jgi:RNA polymerase sigma-70 factor (ECF subfamily)
VGWSGAKSSERWHVALFVLFLGDKEFSSPFGVLSVTIPAWPPWQARSARQRPPNIHVGMGRKPLNFFRGGTVPTSDMPDLSCLLAAAAAGDTGAKEQLFALVYQELRGISGRLMRQERPDHTLQTTALVHEAFLRLSQSKSLGAVPNRRYFFGAATRAMRQILAEHGEARATAKRGGDWQRVPLDDVLDHLEAQQIEATDLHDALEKLETLDERQAQVVTMKFMYGYTTADIASLLEISESTVENDWRFARAWLRGQLKESAP